MAHSGSIASIRIDALTKDNYDTWKMQVEALLIKTDAWTYVSGEKILPITGAEQIAAWHAADRKARSDLILTISPSELKQVRGCITSRDVWLKLESVYASKGPARKATLLKQLMLHRMQENEDVREHFARFFDVVDKLENMEIKINPDLLAIMILYSLPASYENFRCAIECRDVLPDPESLRVKILEEHGSRKQSSAFEVQGAMVADRASKKSFKPLERNANKDYSRSNKEPFKYKCFKCHKVGHRASDCKSKGEHRSTSTNAVQLEEFDDSFAVFTGTATASLKGDQCSQNELKGQGVQPRAWILDSGCTSHLCSDVERFTALDKSIRGKLNLASQDSTRIEGKGAVRMSANVNGEQRSVEFQNTLFVPHLRHNLISVAKIIDQGKTVTFQGKTATVTDASGGVRLTADRIGNLYYIREEANLASTTKCPEVTIQKWHERFGHLNAIDLAKVVGKLSVDVNDVEKIRNCDICLKGKLTRMPFPKGTLPCAQKLKIVHSDVAGPMRKESIGGARYFATFIDDSTRWCEVYLLQKKSGVFEAFKTYKNHVEKQTGCKIKVLQSDNGREYINGDFDRYLEMEGIERRLTIAHTPQQNGVAERMNRTLMEMARCMLLQSNLPEAFWAEALVTACHIRNRCPTSALKGKIPYEQWTGMDLKVDYLRVFGSKVYVLDKTPTKSKFAARSREGVFIGYPRSTKGYRIWVPEERKVIIARDVKFIEEFKYGANSNGNKGTWYEMETMESSTQKEQSDIKIEEPSAVSTPSTPEPIQRRAPGRPKLLKTGFRGRPKKIFHVVNDEDQSDEPEINSDENIDDVFVNFSGIAEISLDEAMASDDREEWEEAILAEIRSLLKNDTLEIIKCPKDANVIGSRFVLANKFGAEGVLERKKARLVARGFSQQYGVDYNQTFAPVARLETIRLLCALAVEWGLKIHQLDITTAYLNGHLEE